MSVGVCCTMCCMRQGNVNNMSQAAYRYAPFQLFRRASSVKVCESAAQRAVVRIGRMKRKRKKKKKKQSQRKCVEKE